MKLLFENWRNFLAEKEKKGAGQYSKLGLKNIHIDVPSDSEMGRDVEDDVINLVSTAYAPIGGFPRLSSAKKLRNTITNYYLIDIDDDPEPDAGMLYYDAGEYKKSSAIIHDGTPEAKKMLTRAAADATRPVGTMKDLLSKKGHWIEVSGAPEHILKNKLGMPAVDDEELARYLVTFGYQRDVGFKWIGDGHYERQHLGGTVTKTIIGNVTRDMFPGIKDETPD